MKKANGEGSFRRIKNNLWEGRICVGRGPDGKMQRRSIYGKTKREVMEKAAAIVTEIANGTYIAPDQITVEQWLDIWQKEYILDVKPSTAAQYDYQIRVHIVPNIGQIQLQKLTPPIVQNLYNKLADSYEETNRFGKTIQRPGISAKSIKNLHGVLHKALQQAVYCLYIKSNPCEPCKLPKREKELIQPLEGDNICAFLEEIPIPDAAPGRIPGSSSASGRTGVG